MLKEEAMSADDQARQPTTTARRHPEASPQRAVQEAGTLEFRARPCGGEPVCPWRGDADLTAYTDEDVHRLIEASEGDTRGGAYNQADAERMISARRMACHLDQPGTAHPLRLCAGWLVVVGPHHYRARLALLTGQLPPAALYPDTRDWPPLVDGLDELLARRDAQLAALGPAEPADVRSPEPSAAPQAQPRVEPRS